MEHGPVMVQEVFKKVLSDLGSDLHHNMFGCKGCRWEGRDIIYCRQSQHHQDHPLHVCPGLTKDVIGNQLSSRSMWLALRHCLIRKVKVMGINIRERHLASWF